MKVELPLRALFEAPTVEQLANRLAREAGPPLPPLVPVPRDRPLPLSFAQQRLWFLEQLDPGSPVYHLPVVLRLSGLLDTAALDRALQTVIDRHEALRTVFVSGEDGRATQVIRPRGDAATRATIPVTPASAADVQRLAAEATARPFDLSNGPLLRTSLLRLAEEDHVLVFTMHHIVSDAWSMDLLVREITLLYDAFHRGVPPPLGDLPLQYGDYTVWQRALLEGETLERDLAFWKRELAGAPPALELPTDRPRPKVQTHRGGAVDVTIPPALTRELHALSRAQGVTLFMLLLAAFDVLLAQYARQRTIVVGTPIAGRTRRETEELIGLFVDTLALRVDVRGTFLELLAQVRERVLGAFAHQHLPFDRLVEALEPERDLSRFPIFQVLFALQNAPTAGLALDGVSLSPVEGTRELSVKVDLELYVVPLTETLACSFLFNADLFDRATVEQMAESFELLLDAIVEAPVTHV
jgi:hypothetical protein